LGTAIVFSTAHKGILGLNIDATRITGDHRLFHRFFLFFGRKWFSFRKKHKINDRDDGDKKEKFKHP